MSRLMMLGMIVWNLIVFVPAMSAAEPAKPDDPGAWIRDAGFGVMVHYQAFNTDANRISIEKYNALVDQFDVERFADQVERIGAAHVLWALGQNGGYYCAPNATLDKILGGEPGRRTSRRDVPLELGRALQKRGIRLMLYLPSRAPQRDPVLMEALGDVAQNLPAPQKFVENWSAICREWSLRYGELVSGWWFDGYYAPESWNDLSKPFNSHTWAEAVRAGNPDAALAFNKGSRRHKAFQRSNNDQTYTAGEMPGLDETPETWPGAEGLDWHILIYLGRKWGQAGAPRYDAAALLRYIDKLNAQEGVLTLDIPMSAEGDIPPQFLDVLLPLGKHAALLRNGKVDAALQTEE